MSSLPFSIVVNTVFVLLATPLVLLFGFILFAPKPYDAYTSDQIVFGPSGEGSSTYAGQKEDENEKPNIVRVSTSVQIIVLGDIGRSPRMQYHAISLAKHGARVILVGFVDTEVHSRLRENRLVTIVPLTPPPSFLQTTSRSIFMLTGPLKVLWQTINLTHTLCYRVPATKWTMLQNPPSIPVLAIARVIAIIRNSSLVIDWHNFGWSILSLKLGERNPLVTISKFYDRFFSIGVGYHFAVSESMARWLRRNFKLTNVHVLRDRPSSIFQPLTTPSQRSLVLQRLGETSHYAKDMAKGSWRLIVSSTSWTPDEDFSLLLDALKGYSALASKDKSLPKILAIITGKGPEREEYIQKVKQLERTNKLSNVKIVTCWLDFEDYAALLGAADLGVSLHKSTSGLDLPMKVVDMFGAGIPVVGYAGYTSWSELVKEDVNGKGFHDADELEELLVNLLSDGAVRLQSLKEGAMRESQTRWDDEWDVIAGKKVFLPDLKI